MSDHTYVPVTDLKPGQQVILPRTDWLYLVGDLDDFPEPHPITVTVTLITDQGNTEIQFDPSELPADADFKLVYGSDYAPKARYRLV